MKRWKIAGINFDHMHMGDNLRMAFEHPRVDIVALSDEDPERMVDAAREFKISEENCYTDYRRCLEATEPDLVLLCPATAMHGEWTERIAPFGVHVIMEKPFAATVAEADAMVAAMAKGGGRLAINWPLAWYPPHLTAKRLIDEGRIGDVREVHYYDGNRGPLYHVADKVETTDAYVAAQKPQSWFYKRAHGGGSLLDYLGYGTTLGTWYHGGAAPIEVACVVDQPAGLEVDEHSITVARYEYGLSRFETRWGTFSDPWTHQPQPKCGFVICGTDGTISSYDYESTIRVQTRDCPEGQDLPVDAIANPRQNPIQYVVDCLERDVPIEGPLSPETCRVGQQIVDAAALSAERKEVVRLGA